MIKVWILILTTGGAHIDAKTQEIRMFSEETCRTMESQPTVLEGGIYWSARCKSILVKKKKKPESK
jgi:hypothetical protein